MDQRVEGTGRCQGHPLGAGTDPAGLVLCGRARCCPRVDHRPGVFPADGRDRAMAVPPGAQARRATAWRLAVRLPARFEEHTSGLQSPCKLVSPPLLAKKKILLT